MYFNKTFAILRVSVVCLVVRLNRAIYFDLILWILDLFLDKVKSVVEQLLLDNQLVHLVLASLVHFSTFFTTRMERLESTVEMEELLYHNVCTHQICTAFFAIFQYQLWAKLVWTPQQQNSF
jgi:hypothetical protein